MRTNSPSLDAEVLVCSYTGVLVQMRYRLDAQVLARSCTRLSTQSRCRNVLPIPDKIRVMVFDTSRHA